MDDSNKRKEIYTYQAPWPVYAMSWCRRPDIKFRMAIGSYKEEYSNEIKIIQLYGIDNKDSDGVGTFRSSVVFDHPYPPTKLMFAPPYHSYYSDNDRDLLATTGDYLRLWSVSNNSAEMNIMLNNNKHSEYCAPLTSFDWNEADPNIIGVCSIDTTCTIWDLTKQQPKTQLIAHDKEVYDFSFSNDANMFATVGADGSLRMFDLRFLEHSTILYETSDSRALLRLVWNKIDSNFIAVTMVDSNKTTIIDIRMPSMACVELSGHTGDINSIAWAPHSPYHICTAAEDRQALIWDITSRNHLDDPVLAYTAEGEINQLQWCSSHEDYVGISYDNYVQFLKV